MRLFQKILIITNKNTALEMKFSIKVFSVNVTKSAVFCGVTFTEEILNEKFHFLCSKRFAIFFKITIFQNWFNLYAKTDQTFSSRLS